MKEVRMKGGQVALVDDEDFERVSNYKWHAHKNWATHYAHRTTKDRKIILMHHFIIGRPPLGMEVDHIDFNGLNNQKSNLRFVTHQENMKNCRKKAGASSKHPYVSWHKRDKRWQVVTTINGKQKHLGNFKDETDAVAVYRRITNTVPLTAFSPS